MSVPFEEYEKKAKILLEISSVRLYIEDKINKNKFKKNMKFYTEELLKRGFTKHELKDIEEINGMSAFPEEQIPNRLAKWLESKGSGDLIEVKVIRNPLSRDLKQFYDEIYVHYFPDEDERESLTTYRKYILMEGALAKYKDLKMKNHLKEKIKTRYYFVLAKLKGVIVGGIIFYTVSTKKTSFASIDYLATSVHHLKKFGLEQYSTSKYKMLVNNALIEKAKTMAGIDAKRFGSGKLAALLAEPNDPARMDKNNKLGDDSENPILRLRLFSMAGFRFFDFPWIQPALEKDQDPVDNLFLACYPYRSEWITKGIDPEEFKYIILTMWSTWYTVDLKTDKTVQRAVGLCDKLGIEKKRIRLLNFNNLNYSKEFKDKVAEFFKKEEPKIEEGNWEIQELSKENIKKAINVVNKVFPKQSPLEKASLGFKASLSRTNIFYKLALKAVKVTDLSYWVAMDLATGKVLGTTGLYTRKKDEDEAYWVGWFCVDPEARGRKIGSGLLDFTIEKAREEGKRFLRLYTSNDPNELLSHKLYEKRGFSKIGEEPKGKLKIIYYELKL